MRYYFAHLSNYNKTYGSLGAVIILMLWFYVVALLFVVGAELNAELPEAGSRVRRTGDHERNAAEDKGRARRMSELVLMVTVTKGQFSL